MKKIILTFCFYISYQFSLGQDIERFLAERGEKLTKEVVLAVNELFFMVMKDSLGVESIELLDKSCRYSPSEGMMKVIEDIENRNREAESFSFLHEKYMGGESLIISISTATPKTKANR